MMSKINQQENVAIIGGGISGISAAIELAKTGRFQVTLFEKERHLGGLSSSFEWQDMICDRFYHVILSADTNTLDFIKEIGLERELFWTRSQSGFYGKGKLVSLSSSLDYIRFPFLSLYQKFRLGLGILYSAKIKDPSKIDEVYAEQWLSKVFGRKVYKNIWEPLLRSKLGDAKDRTSAAFIWATISRMYGARSSGSMHEKMGHVHGNYNAVVEAARQRLSELGVKIMTSTPVLKIEPLENSKLRETSLNMDASHQFQKGKKIRLITKSGHLLLDRILFAIPCPEVIRILDQPNQHPYWQNLTDMDYLGVTCVLLILRQSLSPFYVINLLDKELPFTGIIESTNIIPPQEVGNRHLVYLPKYTPKDDPLNLLPDDQIIKTFLDKLKTVFPDFKNKDILHKSIFHEPDVQPIQELNFLKRIPSFRTPLANVYLSNASMICDSTLNNDAVINLAREAAKTIISDSMNKESF
jgi:protoporphyrinogen oxidase